MTSLIEDFLVQHAALKGTTQKRQVDQRMVLLQFEDFMAPRRVEEATGSDLRDWMVQLVSSGLHVNTVRKYRYALQPFFRWLRDIGVIDRMNWLDLKDVSNPRGSCSQGRPNPYSRRELMRFWQELDGTYPHVSNLMLDRWQDGRSKWYRVRTHFMRSQTEAVVALALYCGLRSREIYLAGVDDIHPDNEFVVVLNGKRSIREAADAGKVRQVPYPDTARRLIDNWLYMRDSLLRPPHDSTWLTLGRYEQHRLGPMRHDVFKAQMQRVGDWHLHRFRHTCATEWLRAGMPLEEVSRLLGHSTLQQTLAYAKLVPDDIARSIRRFQSRFERAIGRPEEDADDDDEAAR